MDRMMYIVLLITFFPLVLTDTYYVTSTTNTSCPEEGAPCFTLSQYAAKPTEYFTTNTTFILLPGTHNLKMAFKFENLTNLIITAFSTTALITITCAQSATLSFESIGYVHVSSLSLQHCAGNVATHIELFTLEDFSYFNQRHNGTGLELKNVTHASMERANFTSIGGSVPIKIISSRVLIANCSFDGSTLDVNSSMIHAESSIAALIHVSFINNRAHNGSMVYTNGSTVFIRHAAFANNTCIGRNDLGCAIYILLSTVSINSSMFVNNTLNGNRTEGGALFTYFGDVRIDNCVFHDNSAVSKGGAISADFSILSIDNSEFSNNKAAEIGGAISVHVAFRNMNVYNCTFINNTADNGGGLYALSSKVALDNSKFIRCRGRGGAIGLVDSSCTIVSSTFIENKATLDRFARESALYLHVGNVINAGGAMYTLNSRVTVKKSNYIRNTANAGEELVVESFKNTSLENSTGLRRLDANGGAITSLLSYFTIDDCTFTQNQVFVDRYMSNVYSKSIGGAICSFNGILIVKNSHVIGNVAAIISDLDPEKDIATTALISAYGGGFFALNSTVTIDNTSFVQNSVAVDSVFNTSSIAPDKLYGYGGAIQFTAGTIRVQHSVFLNNSANQGGALAAGECNLIIENNTSFIGNRASGEGGAVWYESPSWVLGVVFDVIIINSTFDSNTALFEGAAMHFVSASFKGDGTLDIKNSVGYSAVTAQNSTLLFFGSTSIVNSSGSALIALVSNISFAGSINIIHNINSHQDFLTSISGAVYSVQSEIIFSGTVNLMYNEGFEGGAIYATESKLNMYGEITIAHNIASMSGGAIYLYQSEVNVKGRCTLSGNVAHKNGGGISAISSPTRLLEGSLQFYNNNAMNGGGMYLESNSKLFVIKTVAECSVKPLCNSGFLAECFPCNDDPYSWLRLEFSDNSAQYGGALYVVDDTNSDICASTNSSLFKRNECFLQQFAIFTTNLNYPNLGNNTINLRNTYFSNNTGYIAGNSIFGGLLDRCHLSRYAEITKYFSDYSQDFPHSLPAYQILASYNVTTLQNDYIQEELSSFPVRVCFCRGDQPDCSYRPTTLRVRKGERFSVSVVAADQVNNTVSNSSIHSSVSPQGGLNEGQSIQITNESCAELQYNVFSPHNSEEIILYAEGPCKDRGISRTSFRVTFTNCPVGFVDSDTKCECDAVLRPDYIKNCSIDTEKVRRKDDVWITYRNTSDYEGYLLHMYCPLDYCVPGNWIDLDSPNDTDGQCAFNRTGNLCGSCKESLSLSLGTSRCVPCSNNWLALLVLFLLAGIALVAFLLVCNFTVDVGTISGFTFYANFVSTNPAIFAPFKIPNVFSIFIAWFNLDFGFETCFFDGMDGYTKTWLQFAFPLYTILLVVAIIVVSEHSPRLTRLIRVLNRRPGPIATLATLILLSYTKLLRTIIAALSFTRIKTQYGPYFTVWLFDGNIDYLKGKHIPLFIAALLVLMAGLVYTLFLFFWQWIYRWTSNSRLIALMDAYQNPYNPKHRYWTGLLLLVRVVLYLVSALNVTGDPSVNFLSIISLVGGLLLVKEIMKGKVYKHWLLNALESSIFFNIIIFVAATWYARENQASQVTLAYVSVSIVFLTFLAVLVYHTCNCTYVLTKPLQKIKKCLKLCKNTPRLCDTENVESELLVNDSELPTYSEVDGVPTVQDTNPEDVRDVDVEVTEGSTNRESSATDIQYELQTLAGGAGESGDDIDFRCGKPFAKNGPCREAKEMIMSKRNTEFKSHTQSMP